MDRAAVILAAGKGTRMRSSKPKVMHAVGGRMMVDWSLALATQLSCARTVLVIGTHSDELRALAEARVGAKNIAVQDPPQGTGHAVQVAREALDGFSGHVVVLYADTPLLPVDAVERAFAALDEGADISVLGFDAADPGGYGRLVTAADGELLKIVEAKDASPDELSISFCNSGVMAVRAEHLFRLLDQVDNRNAKQEYYLTDIVEIGRRSGLRAQAVRCDEEDVLGVNSRVQLAEAEAVFQARRRRDFMEEGVTLIDPDSVFFSFDTVIGQDVEIEPNVVFGPGVCLETNVIIRAFSHIEGAKVAEGSVIGPFARLRPGTDLGSNVRIGNFVEVKNVRMDDGAKANHLAYLGDGDVGANANIGAGTIFCNYNGYEKNRTIVGENAFIGSNSALVAPVRIGANAMTGSGSVITENVEEGALALGRARQVTLPDKATAFHERMSKKKQD